tara:strand:+ start:38 stop:793 length:756 start_codon:yes stop_codon:yes gene_type:complete
MLKIFIALSTFNRKNITKLCLENLKEIIHKDKHSKLAIYDDASHKYDIEFLKKYSSHVLRFRTTGGIERSRARSFRDFEYIFKNFDLLYITDNDTIHDPDFLSVLREIYNLSAVNFEKKMPIGLFNSIFHSDPKNIIQNDNLLSIRKTCPGVSQCYDRSMVTKILDFLNKNPVYETLYGFDYHWPASLGVPFIQSNVSYVEHFARDKDEKGIHSDFNEDDPIKDFERDRAQSPTSYLQKIRMKIIDKILSA